LLTDDISMPPMPFEYEGRRAAARFRAGLFGCVARQATTRLLGIAAY
jgi:hypothetical protein